MGKKLVSKTEFARLCGVSGGAVTKFVQGVGAGAVIGARVDFNHPAAQQYYTKQTQPRPEAPAPGVDPLFGQALDVCRKTERWTANFIRGVFNIGSTRARRIMDQLQAAGHVPAPDKREPTPPQAKPAAKPRQHGKGRKSSWDDDMQLVEIPADIGDMRDLPLREIIDRFGTEYRFLDWLKSLKEIEAVNEKRIKNAQSEGKLISRDLVKNAVLDRIDGVFVKLLTDATTTISNRAYAMVKANAEEKEVKSMVEDQLASFIRPAKVKMREALKLARN